MNKQLIAVDIDEVLSPFVAGLVDWHNLRYGTDYQFNDYNSYCFDQVWGGSQEMAVEKASEYFFDRKPEVALPLENAKRVLKRLKENYNLMVVTSRMLLHKDQTNLWIQTHFPGFFDDVILCNHWANSGMKPIKKSEVCQQYQAKYLIDDLPHYIEEAALSGVTGLLFGQ